MAELTLVIPDTHYPDHDKTLWNTALRAVKTLQPARVIHIGDVMDYPQPSRWTKGTRQEFEGSVNKQSLQAVRDIIEPLRNVYSGQILMHEGNHDARPRLYMEKYAPALADTVLFNFESLLRFDDYNIERAPDFYPIAPGWYTTHGHLGGIRLNQNAGMTALNGAKKLGCSLIMGHTHRAGVCSYTMGLPGKTSTVTGVEVGHIVDIRKVTYLKGGAGNWQKTLAGFWKNGNNITPVLYPVSRKTITIEGREYRL